MKQHNAGCARRAEDKDIATAVRERKHGNGRKDEERAEEQHREGEGWARNQERHKCTQGGREKT